MSVTIKDIAKVTGLGLATVSAYLNNVNVRPKNKEAIEKAIAELGYIRNEYARGLKIQKSMTIGVLIPELKNIFSTTIISSMEDIFREKGYGVIIADCKNDIEIERKSIDFLLSKMVDGLIVMPITTKSNQLKAAIEKNIPMVIIDRLTDTDKVPHIVINNREVSKKAVLKLIDNGHRKIAIITGNENVYTAYERLLGYKEALQSNNIDIDNTIIYDGEYSIKGGYKAMKEILSMGGYATAVFVANYEMTIGAILAINESNKSIPDDISVIGFDNMEMSQIVTPALATINQPLEEIGESSARILLDIIDKKVVFENIILQAEFLEGKSIKKI